MTEISTNEVNFIESLSLDQLTTEDDLEPHEKRFYKSLFLHLNSIRHYPKQDTILKIMAHSKSKNNFK
ncbi:MAG: hypothetical protein EOP42_26390 [Sphingobacteriaceae bacterium]|nr:MAG: hypothetical protein EOP42_26390 [Sphingobacteriaceae bacterium]